jgi:hypothetical protein
MSRNLDKSQEISISIGSLHQSPRSQQSQLKSRCSKILKLKSLNFKNHNRAAKTASLDYRKNFDTLKKLVSTKREMLISTVKTPKLPSLLKSNDPKFFFRSSTLKLSQDKVSKASNKFNLI